MEFDKSKILTCVTGSREFEGRLGWFADTPLEMAEKIKNLPPTKLILYAENDTYPFKRDVWCPTTLFYPAPEPTYAERQAQWVKENNVHVGTKVRVTRTFIEDEDGCECWKHDDLVGKTGIIQHIIPISLGVDMNDGYPIALPYFALEVIKEPTYHPFNAEELCTLVGKVVTNRLTGYPNLVTGVTNSGKSVFVGTSCVSASVLLDKFTLNGEPCGMKEEA